MVLKASPASVCVAHLVMLELQGVLGQAELPAETGATAFRVPVVLVVCPVQ
jgi:hypothetical protein